MLGEAVDDEEVVGVLVWLLARLFVGLFDRLLGELLDEEDVVADGDNVEVGGGEVVK